MKAHIVIDDARPTYPVFFISKAGDASAVTVPATREQILRWRTAEIHYQEAQREMSGLVNHYEPVAIQNRSPKRPYQPPVKSRNQQ